MLARIRDLVRRFQELLGPINRLPSWANELLSGVLAVGIAWALLLAVHSVFGVSASQFVIPLALILSELYEHLLDPWGYNPQDVVERVRGVVLAALLWMAVYCYLTYAPLPSQREPFDPLHILPHQYLTIIDQRSGADPVANSDPARLSSLSPRPRSSLHGVPLARV